MAEFDPHYDPNRHLVTARLSLRPSDALREAVEPFYAPSVAGRRLSRIALRSSIGVPLEALPAQRFVYADPVDPGRNAIQAYEAYKRQHVRPIVGRQLPQLTSLGILRNRDNGALRLKFAFGLATDERQHLSQLREFAPLARHGGLEAQLDIAPSEILRNEVMLRDAVASLLSTLGINHPAGQDLPPDQRYVGNMYSAAIESEELSFRMNGT